MSRRSKNVSPIKGLVNKSAQLSFVGTKTARVRGEGEGEGEGKGEDESEPEGEREVD